jgi:hypothetical protein
MLQDLHQLKQLVCSGFKCVVLQNSNGTPLINMNYFRLFSSDCCATDNFFFIALQYHKSFKGDPKNEMSINNPGPSLVEAVS